MKRLETIRDPSDVRRLPLDELPLLCAELREEIVGICERVGGHLGASLGAVELIVALHRVFKSPVDRLVFDVGHQAYAHKLLTGRREAMQRLRQEGGASPFLDPKESVHDALLAGHACTAVSAALGMLEAKALLNERGTAVAVIGDGSLTGGLTFEGLNNAATARSPLKIVLNDNQMSITVNVGGISRLLQGDEARAFFEALGFTYLGPVDGHALGELIATLEEARRCQKPVVVHARTQKGRGFAEAEADARTRGHAMGPFQWRDGKLVRSRQGRLTFSEVMAQAIEARMAEDRRVVAVTPAMLEGSALTQVAQRFPGRVFDVGIAEQHAVTFSAGLAAQGLRPICAIYSTFLQRALDQVIHDVVLPGLPVVLAIDRAGLVGADGATHQGAFDLAMLRPLPNLRLCAPVVGEDLAPLLADALSRNGPTAIRFPRLTIPELPDGWTPPTPGKARWLRRVEGAELTVVTLGPAGLAALEAARERPRWSVLDATYLSPLDEAALLEAGACGRVLVVEEGTTRGGLFGAVVELFARAQRTANVQPLGLPEGFVAHGDARAQRTQLGLDAAGIRAAAERMLG